MRLVGLSVLALIAMAASVYAYVFLYQPELLPYDMYLRTADVVERVDEAIEDVAPSCTRSTASLVDIPLPDPLPDSAFEARRVDIQRTLPADYAGAPVIESDDRTGHLLSHVEGIRTSDAEAIWPDTVTVSLIVDERGRVAAVAPRAGPKRFFPVAVAIANRWRFEPFWRDQKPTAVRIEGMSIPIALPERRPKARVAFPAISDWSSLKIKLNKDNYDLTIRGDGVVTYEGRYASAVQGVHCAVIRADAVRQLITQFRRADFFWLHDAYAYPITHAETVRLSIEFDDHSKQLSDYVGSAAGLPDAVSHLERLVAETAGVRRWLKGDAFTGATLTAERWDFKSDTPANRMLLSGVIENGSIEAVREVMALGAFVPITASDAFNEPREPALALAAWRHDPAFTRAMLDAPIRWNQRALDAALSARAAVADIDLMRELIARGAKADGHIYDKTLLMHAARSGVPEAVAQALALNHDIGARDRKGQTALHAAVGSPDLGVSREVASARADRGAVIKMLVRAGADTEARDDIQWTPLLHDWHGDIDVARALIAMGADINAKDGEGQTLLMMVSTSDVARLLLASGADPLLRHKGGSSALLTSARNMNFEVTRLLLESGVAWDSATRGAAAYYAAQRSEARLLDELIAAGIDVNVRADVGRTPLMGAAMSGNAEMVRKILALKPDVNVVDDFGITPLRFASGPDPGQTIFGRDWRHSVELLLEAGADLNHRNERGATAMFGCPVTDVISLLADRGSAVNDRDKVGGTPLMACVAAAKWDQTDSLARVRTLLALGADVRARNADGEAALDIAKQGYNADLIDLLEEWIAAHPPRGGGQAP